jgi:hypothetical protein
MDPWYLAGGVLPYECVAAYQPIGAANLAASLINLANPGVYNAAAGVLPTFDPSTGWTFNGSQYLNTGIIPSGSRSLIMKSKRLGDAGDPSQENGVSDGGKYICFGNYSPWAIDYCLNGSGVDVHMTPILTNTKVLAIAGTKAYRNKAIFPGSLPDSGTFSIPFFIGARNEGGSPAYGSYDIVVAFAYYNTAITESQVFMITDAMNALTDATAPPYEMQRQLKISRFYSFPAVITFNPAWARRQSQIIGGGLF